MKKFFLRFGNILAAVAIAVTTVNANSACVFVIHQAKLPDEAKKLRKF